MAETHLIPMLAVDTRVEEWKVAEVGERTIFLRVRVRRIAGAAGRLYGAEVAPFEVVVADGLGRVTVPIPDGDEGANYETPG